VKSGKACTCVACFQFGQRSGELELELADVSNNLRTERMYDIRKRERERRNEAERGLYMITTYSRQTKLLVVLACFDSPRG